jgi:hypothetical protein
VLINFRFYNIYFIVLFVCQQLACFSTNDIFAHHIFIDILARCIMGFCLLSRRSRRNFICKFVVKFTCNFFVILGLFYYTLAGKRRKLETSFCSALITSYRMDELLELLDEWKELLPRGSSWKNVLKNQQLQQRCILFFYFLVRYCACEMRVAYGTKNIMFLYILYE